MLDYPTCWTSARRCTPKSDCAPVPPHGKKKGTAGFEPPQNSLPHFTPSSLAIGPLAHAHLAGKNYLWICSLRVNFSLNQNQTIGRSRRPLAFLSHASRLSTAPGHLRHLILATNLTTFGHIVHNHSPIYTIRPKGGGLFKFKTPTACENFWGSGEGGGGGRWVGRSAARVPTGEPVGTPKYISQIDPHDALIILNIHKWGKKNFQQKIAH